MVRLATGITVVGSLELLLVESGSAAVPETLAVLVTPGAAAAPTATTKVMVLLPPEARPVVLVPITLWPDEPVKSQPEPLAETKVIPVGSVSVNDSVPEGSGPALLTTRV